MKDVLRILPLALLALSTGCDAVAAYLAGEVPAAELHVEGEPTARLEAEVLVDWDSLAMPGQLRVQRDRLLVLDYQGNTPIRVFDRETGALVASFGQKGEGPGEFRAAWALDPVPGEDAFWVYDAGLSRMTRIALDAGASMTKMLKLTSPGTVMQPVWVDESGLLALGIFSGGRLGFFDAAGHFEEARGLVPGEETDAPLLARQEAYQGTMAWRPDRTRFAVAARYADRIDLYDAAATHRGTAERPFGFEPLIRTADGEHFSSGPDTRFGYVAIAATADRIYGLYSGRTRRGFPGRANYADHVHVFDWSGRLLRVLRLPGDAIALAAHGPSSTLYAIHHAPRPVIVRYRIPPLPAPSGDSRPPEISMVQSFL